MSEENNWHCKGCGHSLAEHIQSVDGKVYCWHVDSGWSTGVIATYSCRCDCVNYKSRAADTRRDKGRLEQEEMDKYAQQISEAAKAATEKVANPS